MTVSVWRPQCQRSRAATHREEIELLEARRHRHSGRLTIASPLPHTLISDEIEVELCHGCELALDLAIHGALEAHE
jgi:hypothetical protein